MNRFEAMKAFVRVVETGSFSEVARELNIGQPAVTSTCFFGPGHSTTR